MSTPEEQRLVAWGTEMRATHGRLRKALELVTESLEEEVNTASNIEAGTAPVALPEQSMALSRELLLYCRGFCTALDQHHRSEDRALFPELEARHPELGDVLRNLRQDHSMMAHLITGLEHVLDAAQTPAEVHRHVEGLGAIMESHFRYEEARLLSVLDLLELRADVADLLGPL